MIGYIIENAKEYIECQKYIIFDKGCEWRYSGQKIKTENILKDFPIVLTVDEYNRILDSIDKYKNRKISFFDNNHSFVELELINWKKFNRSLKLKSII
jgi:hypothetical protein